MILFLVVLLSLGDLMYVSLVRTLHPSPAQVVNVIERIVFSVGDERRTIQRSLTKQDRTVLRNHRSDGCETGKSDSPIGAQEGGADSPPT